MITLVTGATGMIGANIVAALSENGTRLRALVRDPNKGRRFLPASCELATGDITEPDSIAAAMQDVSVVYHAAGLPEQWFADPDIFTRVNVDGTRNVVQACQKAKVKRLVYTSTIDVFSGTKDQQYDESLIDPQPKGTYYERSKQAADRIVVDALEQGLDCVFLHPAGLYGPGPAGSPGANQLVLDLILGKVPMLLPGGFPLVYSLDCARAHILAGQTATAGARFILSERYVTLVEFARALAAIAPVPKIPRVMPLWFARAFAAAGESVAKVIGKPPLLPRGQLHFLQWGARPSSARARAELGWQTTAFEEGLRGTVEYLVHSGALPPELSRPRG